MLGLRSKVKRNYKATTDSYHNHYVVPNVLNRKFTIRNDGPFTIFHYQTITFGTL